MTEEILIGRWDCSSCGTKGVMGDAYRCHSCGAGRPDDVEFYLPSDAEVVKDAAGIAAAKAGSDWMCGYCGQWVAAVEKACPNCAGGGIAGSRRQESGETVRVVDWRSDAKLDCPYTDTAGQPCECDPPCRDRDGAVQSAVPTRTDAPATGSRRAVTAPVDIRGLLSCIGFVLLAALMGVGGWAIFRPRDVIATVSGHSWTRVQHVEEYRALSQDGWDKPADAYNVRVERRVHHHDRVLDHHETRTRIVYDRVADGTERVRTGTRTRSLGNGRFERTPTYTTKTRYKTVARTERYDEPVYRRDPVYRDYYLYMVDRWVPGEDRHEQGVGLDPRWPSTAVRDARQRMAAREENYSITLTERSPEPGEQARTWSRSFDEAGWRSWRDGMIVTATIQLGSVVDLKAVELEQPAAGRK